MPENPLRKILHLFFSTTWGAWCFAFVLASLFAVISVAYLAYYGRPEKNFVENLQPLAVILIGLTAVFIAFRNHWEKLGHEIVYRQIDIFPSNTENISDMPYIKNLILYNRKNKVEIINKILLFSKKLKYTILADFEESPRVLKEYSTTLIELDPVTIWAKDSEKKNFIIKEYITSLPSGEAVIKTLKEGVLPIFYATSYNYPIKAKRKLNLIAVTPDGLIPIKSAKFDSRAYDAVILPIRNTEGISSIYFSSMLENKEIICKASVIQVTELTLGKSEAGNSPPSEKIKIVLHNSLERYSFIDCPEKKKKNDIYIFFPQGADKFEEEWKIYYNNSKEKINKKIINRFKETKKNIKKYKKEILAETEIALENSFHSQTVNLFNKPDLSKISSKITSKIFFMHDVKKFAEYPIIKKRHTLFETAFYPTKEENPCFEKIEEIEKSNFSKIWSRLFHSTP